MAMDLAAVNPLLKDEYEDYVAELVHTETTALDLFTEGDVESADGRRVIIPAHLRRDHAGIGYVGEGRTLPTPTAEQAAFFTIPFRKSVARFQITKESIDQAQTSRGSFVRTLSYVMDHLVENLVDIRNKAVCHFGADVLGRVDTNPGASATLIKVKDPGGVVMPTGVTNGSRFFQVGQIIAVLRAGAILANTPVTVTQVVDPAQTQPYNYIKVAANGATMLDGDILVRAGSTTVTDAADTSYLQAPMGLLGMLDDGTYVSDYFGVSRTTWDVAKSYVFTGVGALSSDILQQGVDVAYSRGRGRISKFLCEQAVRRQLIALREGDVRYTGNFGADATKLTLDASSAASKLGSTIEWGAVPVLVDYNFPYGMLLGIDDSALIRYTVIPGKFEDWGGSVLLPAANTHVATGLFYIYDNFFNDAPNKSIRWEGIDSTVSNVHVE
jgi:hypothetical protein